MDGWLIIDDAMQCNLWFNMYFSNVTSSSHDRIEHVVYCRKNITKKTKKYYSKAYDKCTVSYVWSWSTLGAQSGFLSRSLPPSLWVRRSLVTWHSSPRSTYWNNASSAQNQVWQKLISMHRVIDNLQCQTIYLRKTSVLGWCGSRFVRLILRGGFMAVKFHSAEARWCRDWLLVATTRHPFQFRITD